MQNETREGARKFSARRNPAWKLAYRYARRFVLGFFGVLGAIANLFSIYSFGESHNWWGAAFALSPKTQETLWMLAVGIGGPWAMMLGGIVGAKFAEKFTGNRAVTALMMPIVVRISMFFAILHCAQMSFDMKIFPRYLSSVGFFKVAGIYLLAGLAVGVACGFGAHAIRRLAPGSRDLQYK